MLDFGEYKAGRKKRWEDNITKWTDLKLVEAFQKAETKNDGEKWLPDHPCCRNGHLDQTSDFFFHFLLKLYVQF